LNRFNLEDKLPSKEEVFRFVHLSDPHLFSATGVRVRDLLNKRVYAYFSWRLHRRAEHCEEVLAALLKDMQSLKPHHIVLTGDLTHMGLPGEFLQARELLQALGPPSKVMVIPGNHDAYVATAWERTFRLWSDYMASDSDQSCPEVVKDHGIAFPTLRVRGDMAFIGVSTACPTIPLLATGSIGKVQLEKLESVLDETRRRHLVRVVLIHHPPVPGTSSWRKRLTDQSAFQALLARHGAELILHGHTHRTTSGHLETPWGRVCSIGVPSASSLGRTAQRRARYHVFRLMQSAGGLGMLLTVRVFSPTKQCFVDEADQWVPLPQPAG
jgi:Predicted phosphohydrolases